MRTRLPAIATLLALVACNAEPSAPAGDQKPTLAVSSTGAQIITEAEITRQAENTTPTNHWVLYTRNAGAGGFVVGPSSSSSVPAEGIGSLRLSTPTAADKVFLFNYDYVGERLADLDRLSYYTWRTSGGSPNQVPALNIEADVNGPNATGGFTTLVFEPAYNTDQGAVTDGVWQRWDAYNGGNGRWWSTKNIPGVCAFDCFVPWSAIAAANPDATILGGLGFNQGSGNPALDANADALTVGFGGTPTVYDFDPFVRAETREACKNGGWQVVKRADGSSFKNQGDCVSYVNTGN